MCAAFRGRHLPRRAGDNDFVTVAIGVLRGLAGSAMRRQLPLWAALACAPPPISTPWPTLAVSAAGLQRAADPTLEGAGAWPLRLSVRATGYPALTCRLTLVQGERQRVASVPVRAGGCATLWTNAAEYAPGEVTFSWEVATTERTLKRGQETLQVLRVAVVRIRFLGDEIPLLYHAQGGERFGYFVPPDAAPHWLEGVEPWPDTASAPGALVAADGAAYNIASAWTAGAAITLRAQVAQAGTDAQVRAAPPPGTSWSAQGTEIQFDQAPVPGVGRFEHSLEWGFEVRQGDRWSAIPGIQRTHHRFYGLLGTPDLGYDDSPHGSWLAVVDEVSRWVEGGPDATAGEAIVAGVYATANLRYDDENGAAAYASYPGQDYANGRFELSAYLAREYGNVINCSDAAAIVTTYGNMMGMDLSYHILLHQWHGGFDLNFIQPIGFEGFTETPFQGGGGGFRYHAVVGEAGAIYDATLALDGDGVPTALPAVATLAAAMDGEAYTQALSSEASALRYEYAEKVKIR
jgi:hypothetical protein